MGLDANFVSQDVPAEMIGGRAYPVRVRMRNTGTDAWDPGRPFRLGSQAPQDTLVWGNNRAVMARAQPLPPGDEHDFHFRVLAPSRTGRHVFQWRMVQEQVSWFGACTEPVEVRVDRVEVRDAVFVTQQVPLMMPVGKPQVLRVRMRNSGQVPWTAADGFRLGSQAPQDNFAWGANRIPLDPGEEVPGGAERDFVLRVTPQSRGTFGWQWRMVQDGVCWFGACSDRIDIAVY